MSPEEMAPESPPAKQISQAALESIQLASSPELGARSDILQKLRLRGVRATEGVRGGAGIQTQACTIPVWGQ